MSISLPERVSVSAEELERWFAAGGGHGGDDGGNNITTGLSPEDDNKRVDPPGPALYPVAQAVGKTILEQTVSSIEARWENGENLSPEETDILRDHDTVLDLDYEA